MCRRRRPGTRAALRKTRLLPPKACAPPSRPILHAARCRHQRQLRPGLAPGTVAVALDAAGTLAKDLRGQPGPQRAPVQFTESGFADEVGRRLRSHGPGGEGHPVVLVSGFPSPTRRSRRRLDRPRLKICSG